MISKSVLFAIMLIVGVLGILNFGHLNRNLIPEVLAQYEPPPPPPSPPPPPPPPVNTPPGSFGHSTYSTSCPYPSQPKVTFSWTASQYATSYRIYYLDSSVGTAQPPSGITIGNVTSYSLNTSEGLIPGHYYGFAVVALNSYGSAVSNQPPYSPTLPGGWSQSLYGWVLFPDCSPPGAFNFSVAPTPSCPGVSASAIDMNWSVSSGATAYTIYPQSTLRGWLPVAGLAPTTVNGSGGYLRHTIPTPIPANEGWEYTIWATNPYGATSANNSSSYYIFGGWTYAYNCDSPFVDLKIDGTDVIKTINNGSSITLNYGAQNIYNLTTSANPAITPTSPYINLFPANNGVANPWLTSGVVTLTLYNNATYPYSSYQFTITGNNSRLSGTPSDSKSVTVNVLPDKAPFIQTTQGDVHSNSGIKVPLASP